MPHFGGQTVFTKAVLFVGWTICESLMVLSPSELRAQVVNTNSSFSDKFELGETKSVIADSISETEELLKQNLILQEQIRSISAALVDGRQKAESTSAENRNLKSRIEALGLNAVGNPRTKLEQRLVQAVSDLSDAQTSAANYKQALGGLSEAVFALLKTSKDVTPESRLAIEAELRNVNQVLGTDSASVEIAESNARSLSNSRVVSIKPELGLVVGNIGKSEGVKVGMPFKIYEGEQVIALARAVDVREKIFGALIQEKLSDKIPVKVGHRLKVAAE